jgi:peptide/nickel transport system permease protein
MPWGKLLGRFWSLVPTIFGGVSFVFLIIHLIPGDPVSLILRDYFLPQTYHDLQHQLGLDRPLLVQYFAYWRDVLHLNLGLSLFNRRPVALNIAEQLPYTLWLATASIFIAVVLSIPLGMLAARYRNTWPDYVGMGLAAFMIASPEFLLGISLILLFAYYLGWFPSYGVGDIANPFSLFSHLVLPACALGLREMALLARITRATVLETLVQDYVRTARAKGLSARMVMLRHVLKSALTPIITVIGVDLAYLLGGAVVIEAVFSRPGLGGLLLNAILNRDYPQIQGTLLTLITIAVCVNACVDVVYMVIDPRVRYA